MSKKKHARPVRQRLIRGLDNTSQSGLLLTSTDDERETALSETQVWQLRFLNRCGGNGLDYLIRPMEVRSAMSNLTASKLDDPSVRLVQKQVVLFMLSILPVLQLADEGGIPLARATEEEGELRLSDASHEFISTLMDLCNGERFAYRWLDLLMIPRSMGHYIPESARATRFNDPISIEDEMALRLKVGE